MSCWCAHALLPVVGDAVKAGDEVKFVMSKKLFMENVFLANYTA